MRPESSYDWAHTVGEMPSELTMRIVTTSFGLASSHVLTVVRYDVNVPPSRRRQLRAHRGRVSEILEDEEWRGARGDAQRVAQVKLVAVHVALHLQQSDAVIELRLDRVVLVGGDCEQRASERSAKVKRMERGGERGTHCFLRGRRSCCAYR